MSVLIKGMEMPEEGEYHMTLYVCSDGSAYIDVASFPVDGDRFVAVPVPSHGRLIDEKDIVPKDGYIIADGMACIPVKDIDNAPTVIPASKEGET